MPVAYGRNVLEWVAMPPPVDRTVLLIRHSERPSFDAVPFGEWDKVSVTERGVHAARDFGGLLARSAGGSKLRVYSWGQKRCVDTAGAIAKGAKDADCCAVEERALRLPSPIQNREKDDRTIQSAAWEEGVLNWLGAGIEQDIMVPINTYAPVIVRELLGASVCGNREVAVVATHDLHIIPLLSHIFGAPIREVDYLDGLVIKVGPEQAHAAFSKMSKLLEAD